MTSFALKLTAMAAMLIDHTAIAFFDSPWPMRAIGRIAFIIYAFLMAEGFLQLENRPERVRTHLVRFAVLAAVSEAAYDLFDHGTWDDPATANVIITLGLGYAALACAARWRAEHPGAAGVCGSIVLYLSCAYISYAVRSEYKFGGVLLVVLFYWYLRLAGNRRWPARIAGLALVMAVYLVIYFWARSLFGDWAAFRRTASQFRPWYAGTIAAIVPLSFYNRKLGYAGRAFRTLYVWFYPLQFFALLLLQHLLG